MGGENGVVGIAMLAASVGEVTASGLVYQSCLESIFQGDLLVLF